MKASNFPDFKEGTDISAFCFGELPGPLHLDSYQRPYVWDVEKAEQLLSDLRDHGDTHGLHSPYYMGTLLLHQPGNEVEDTGKVLNVIDGQQRLTTLALFYHAMHGSLPGSIQFRFRSTLSHRRIREVFTAIKEREVGKDERLSAVLHNLTFTVVAVSQEDQAFTFFDTQNGRGIPLSTTDLLKSFHLRAIENRESSKPGMHLAPTREYIQTACARRWESLQKPDQSQDSEGAEDFAPELFHYYLWRARNWRGQRTLIRETRKQVLESFQKRSVPSERMDSVPLYPTPGNRMARRLMLDASGDVRLAAGEFRLSDDPSELPFSLRQPIHQGLGFFLYTARYAALARRLFQDEPASDGDIYQYRVFFTQVAAWNSPYVRQLHRLAVLMYYDQFGEASLLRFAWALEYVLGAIRLTKKSVFQRSAMKYLEEAQLNLLDVIAAAYRPEEVLDFLLRPEHKVSDSKRLKDAYAEGRPTESGVQARYFDQLAQYFVVERDFANLTFNYFNSRLRGAI